MHKTYVVVGGAAVIGVLVHKFSFCFAEGRLVHFLFQGHFFVRLLLHVVVNGVFLQTGRTQALLFGLVCEHASIVLQGVRNVGVIGAFPSLHSGAEVSILDARRFRLHVALEGSKVVKRTLHVLAWRLNASCLEDIGLLANVDGLLFGRVHRHDVSPVRHR